MYQNKQGGKNHGILSYMIPDLCVGNNDFYSDLNDNGDCLLLFSVDIPAVFGEGLT